MEYSNIIMPDTKGAFSSNFPPELQAAMLEKGLQKPLDFKPTSILVRHAAKLLPERKQGNAVHISMLSPIRDRSGC